MSERILEALMQLFALVAKIDGVNDNGKSVVENFLKQQYGSLDPNATYNSTTGLYETHH